MQPLDRHLKTSLDQHLAAIGDLIDAEVMAILSPILPGLELRVRDAIEGLPNRKRHIAIVLDTNGGVVEVVERMVETIRHFFPEVTVIVPDKAMSAGTIFSLAADRIMMD